MKKNYYLKPIFCMAVFCALLSASYAQNCYSPSGTAILSGNNINAFFKTDGAHFFYGSDAQFEVPKGSGKTSFFAASLWLGGKDEENNLHIAATRYGRPGNDYWTGPVSNNLSQTSSGYDKFWEITKEEIDRHIYAFENNDPYYFIPKDILNWPAHGNFLYDESFNLAPYKSVSGNNIYTPNEGDYPLIRGDEAIFWINNDLCGFHTESKGEPLGVEVLSMAYAYNSTDYALNNTLFLSYEIRNKSTNNYKDFYIGFFADFDIGYGKDDYIGCDSLLNLAYGYNGTKVDGSGESYAYGANPPAQGAMFLNQKMSSFMYFINAMGPMGDPLNAVGYYNNLNGKWINGVPLTYGGDGYNSESTNYTHYAFSGDPVTKTGWTEVTPNGPGSTPNQPADRRGIMSSGPFTLNAGESLCIDIALPFAQDLEGDNITSVALLKQNAQTIQQFYNQQNYETRCSENIGIKENKKNYDKILVYPNPSNGQFVVSCDQIIENIELYDVVGKKLFTDTPNNNTAQINLRLTEGLYFYRTRLQDGSIYSGKILVQ